MLLALRYYGRQMARLRRFTVPGMLLPALGNTCLYYVAPLFVAQLVGRFASQGMSAPARYCRTYWVSPPRCYPARSCGGSVSTA